MKNLNHEEMDILGDLEETRLLIEYLKVLSDGKIKPDTKNPNGGTIRDALENRDDITAVKNRINQKLKINKNE